MIYRNSIEEEYKRHETIDEIANKAFEKIDSLNSLLLEISNKFEKEQDLDTSYTKQPKAK